MGALRLLEFVRSHPGQDGVGGDMRPGAILKPLRRAGAQAEEGNRRTCNPGGRKDVGPPTNISGGVGVTWVVGIGPNSGRVV